MRKVQRLVYMALSTVLLTACNAQQKSSAESVESVHSTPAPKPIIIEQDRITSASIRGLHLVSDQVGWASGTDGTVLRMINGEHWQEIIIPKYGHLDFRDIEGFDSLTAVAMAAGSVGRIIRTVDGGLSWTEVYTNLDEGIFLDGLDFDGSVGFCIGDPMAGETFILNSQDYGITWQRITTNNLGPALPAEGSYAASGTSVVYSDQHLFAAYGGDSLTRVIHYDTSSELWKTAPAPLAIGAGCGIFSMAFESSHYGVAVGGCYLDSASTKGVVAITLDTGNNWITIEGSPPNGYRSCITYCRSKDAYVTCGRTGVDISYDSGQSWNALTGDGYYTCALGDSTGWLMGRAGKLARMTW